MQFFLGGRCVAAVKLHLTRSLLDHAHVSLVFSVSGVHGRGVSLRRELGSRPLVPLFLWQWSSRAVGFFAAGVGSAPARSAISASRIFFGARGCFDFFLYGKFKNCLADVVGYWRSECRSHYTSAGRGPCVRVWFFGFGIRSSGLVPLARVRACDLGLGLACVGLGFRFAGSG